MPRRNSISANAIAAIVIVLLGIILILILLLAGKISETSFDALSALVGLFGLVILGFPRLRELDLKNLKLTLDEVNSLKEDVYAKTQDLQKISVILVEIISVNSLWLNRLGEDEDYHIRQEWFSVKARELLEALHVTDDQESHVLRFLTILQQLDNPSISPDEQSKVWLSYSQLVKDEVQKAKTSQSSAENKQV